MCLCCYELCSEREQGGGEQWAQLLLAWGGPVRGPRYPSVFADSCAVPATDPLEPEPGHAGGGKARDCLFSVPPLCTGRAHPQPLMR